VDEIYNLACPASPIHYQHDPIFTLKTSIFGTVNMAEIAIKLNAKILHASTSEIYGDPEIHPQIEEYWGNVNPIGLRACYDEGKRCAETLLFDYKRQNNLRLKVARIFNTYGPRMHPKDGRVISTFIIQALNNETITVYGDGMQTRSFCYVDDLIEGFIRLMSTDDNFTGPINLGNPEELSIKELTGTILELTKSKSNIDYFPLPADDPVRRRPDIELAKSVLNWVPKISLRQGLETTIPYFQKN
jgi:UDP-glucuronate decarboxylase